MSYGEAGTFALPFLVAGFECPALREMSFTALREMIAQGATNSQVVEMIRSTCPGSVTMGSGLILSIISNMVGYA